MLPGLSSLPITGTATGRLAPTKITFFNLKDMIFRFSVSFSTVWKASNLGGDSSVYEQILSIMLIFALKFNYYDTSGQGRDQR
jgi:hypothetical protein